ncbi:UDP-N-acetylmuramoyl-L-alanyl-D-glutamate--2,6-diaminopimelate ligase-like [Oratosquilla oratoria]|uniref:UDP-N-acetylmuramoyl-L-alanyl-D-glutamate--2, 6-diaminopimelate ligase-like n=1 Tax=Oratosquilla oratoria TaxID=337810 RepID=UPI003F76D025
MTGRPDAVSYSAQGHSDARWSATDCVYSANGIACRIHCADFSSDVQLSVLGAFNVANVLAACAVAEALGETPASIVARLPQLKTVIGRAELLSSEAGAKVVIDYAHTAQALAAILKTMREHFPARIWCVFGCGGDRDRSKRAEMAKAAFQGADCVVVTSDNPRSEDPQQIIDDVLAGLPTTSNVHAEVDRASAIAYALSHAAADDCVLIAGKGHEDYQVLAERTVAFSDHAEVMRWQAGAS